MRKFGAVVLMGLLWAGAAQAGEYAVLTTIICPKAQAIRDAEAARSDRAAPLDLSVCQRIPPIALPILDIAAGPFKDADGDDLFVVRVDPDGNWFTLAWPGFNTNMPKGGI